MQQPIWTLHPNHAPVPWPQQKYVLYQCGTPNPVDSGVPVPDGAKVMQIPLTSVAVPDTTALAFMVGGAAAGADGNVMMMTVTMTLMMMVMVVLVLVPGDGDAC